MISWEAGFDIIKSNQLLVAGVGTVAFGTIAYVAKSVPLFIFRTLKRLMTIEITINTESAYYFDIVHELSKHRIKLLERLYSTSPTGAIIAGYGISWAWFSGRLIIFSRDLLEKNLKMAEEARIIIYSRNKKIMERLVQSAVRPPPQNMMKIRVWDDGYWCDGGLRNKRPLSSIFANDGVIESAVAKIEWFLKNEAWYIQRGLNYKLVVLLFGEPGTGKTSLAISLACHFNKSLCVVTDIRDPETSLRSTEDGFLLIEDIDMLSMAREQTETPIDAPHHAGMVQPNNSLGEQLAQANLHRLINALDGVTTRQGMVVFMTTNYPEKLDSALLRDSRTDLKLNVAALELKPAARMLAAFYDISDGQAEDILDAVDYEPTTGATLQKIFIEESSPAEAAKRIVNR